MSRLVRSLAAVAAVSAIALAGCSSGGADDSAPEDSDQVITAYFEAFATSDPSTMKPMVDNSEPGSPARVYADHQINVALALESDNRPEDESIVSFDDGVVTVEPKGLSEDPTEEEKMAVTTVYSDFSFGSAGKLQSWTSEPGGVLDGRVFALSGKASSSKVKVKMKTAYETNAGDLFIAYDVTNDSGSRVIVSPQGYINPDKRQVKVEGIPYSIDMAPDTFTTNAVKVENGSVGGKFTITVQQMDGGFSNVTLTIPVKESQS